jgi:pimeloyl-ACP methyl ester carboxylesterase
MINPIPEREPDPETSSVEEVVADCLVVEYDNLSREWTDPRVREELGVRFDYTPSKDLAGKLADATDLVVFCHGWQNSTVSTREFCSKLIKGVQSMAGEDRAGLAYLAVSWNSERLIFHESALAAEVIGETRLAPLLASLRSAHPTLKITLVGHSLGARMVLATLQESPGKGAESAVLLEGAVNRDALVPGREAGFGSFPGASTHADRIANLHSSQDDVLRLTYDTAMTSPALGREGADRDRNGGQYPSVALEGMSVNTDALSAAYRNPMSLGVGPGRIVNIDASAVVSGHSNVFELPVYDLIWRMTRE